jgi:hypothetical protein
VELDGGEKGLVDELADRSVFYILRGKGLHINHMYNIWSLTLRCARRFMLEKGANLTSTLSLPVSLYCAFLICLGAYLFDR